MLNLQYGHLKKCPAQFLHFEEDPTAQGTSVLSTTTEQTVLSSFLSQQCRSTFRKCQFCNLRCLQKWQKLVKRNIFVVNWFVMDTFSFLVYIMWRSFWPFWQNDNYQFWMLRLFWHDKAVARFGFFKKEIGAFGQQYKTNIGGKIRQLNGKVP